MPNLSFDIFFTDDVINITASRSQNAPKVKPAWKVRTAPKLPPKEPPAPPTAVFARPRIQDVTDDKPASTKKVPKLKDAPKAKAAPTPKATPKPKDAPKV
ncbi:hypothetical protein MMC24_002623 [Lignoscripta atroalba]|nr:hypothetical protein [Lignoscripta atroalba]